MQFCLLRPRLTLYIVSLSQKTNKDEISKLKVTTYVSRDPALQFLFYVLTQPLPLRCHFPVSKMGLTLLLPQGTMRLVRKHFQKRFKFRVCKWLIHRTPYSWPLAFHS